MLSSRVRPQLSLLLHGRTKTAGELSADTSSSCNSNTQSIMSSGSSKRQTATRGAERTLSKKVDTSSNVFDFYLQIIRVEILTVIVALGKGVKFKLTSFSCGESGTIYQEGVGLKLDEAKDQVDQAFLSCKMEKSITGGGNAGIDVGSRVHESF